MPKSILMESPGICSQIEVPITDVTESENSKRKFSHISFRIDFSPYELVKGEEALALKLLIFGSESAH